MSLEDPTEVPLETRCDPVFRETRRLYFGLLMTNEAGERALGSADEEARIKWAWRTATTLASRVHQTELSDAIALAQERARLR